MKKLFGKEITDEQFDFLMCEQSKGKEIKLVENEIIAVEYIITEEEKAKTRINELKLLLAKTDYQAIKFAEGELAAEEFEPMRLQRKAWREEIRILGG